MGFLDASLPDPSDLLERAKSHGNTLGALAGAAGAGISATAVAGAPLASVVVPLVAQSYLEAAASDVLEDAEKSLQGAGEGRSDSMVRVCDGICKLIDPLVEDSGSSDAAANLEQVAREDPERVKRVFEDLLNDQDKRDELQQVEQTLGALFAGENPPDEAPIQSNDPEEIVGTLTDVLDADDEREALHLYTVYSEFLSDFTTELQETDPENQTVAESLEEIQQRLKEVERWTAEVVDTFTLLTLKNQAFTQLTALDFERQEPFRSKPPRYLWLTGFNFAELAAFHSPTGRPYYFERGVPADHPLAAGREDEPPSLTTAVVNELQGGSNIMLTGLPASGKSHLCKRVAAEWYSANHGDVFYREAAADKPFTQDAELEQAIETAANDGDGQVLVVVEDAVADHANRIFDVMNEFRRRPDTEVQFLLDARQSQWQEFADASQPQNDPPPFVRIAYAEGASDFLTVVDMPPITEPGCRAAIETFNRTTTGYYGPPDELASRLYDTVTDEQSNRGELLVLSDELLTKSQFGDGQESVAGDTPVRSSAGSLHAEWLDGIDTAGTEPPLEYQLAIAISTFTAADVDLAPALLYGLADDRAEIKQIADILAGSVDLPARIRGSLLIPDESTPSGFQTRHTEWASEFLASQLAADTATADTVHETFVQAISTIANLAEDPQLRSDIRRWLDRQGRETPFLNRLEEDTQQPTEDLLDAVVSIGQQQDGQLAMLLQDTFLSGSITDQENLPAVCSPVFRFELEIQRGWILRQASAADPLQDPEQLFESIIDDAAAALTPPERDWIRARATAAQAEIAKDRLRYPDAIKRFETAIEHYESIEETYRAASTYRRLANLGRMTESLAWDTINDRYDRAIALFRRDDERYEVLRTTTARASAALTDAEAGWNQVVTEQNKALDLFQDSQPTPDVAYWYRRTLREHSRVAQESTVLEWDAVVSRYDRAIEAYSKATHTMVVARLQQELATAASEMSGIEWNRIESLYNDSIRTYRSEGQTQQVARAYQAMAKSSHEHETPDWTTTANYYDDAITAFEASGDHETALELQREKANAASQVSSLDWSTIAQYYTSTIQACEETASTTDVAQAARTFAEAAATAAPDFETVDERYEVAIDQFDTLGHNTEAARLAKRRAQVAASRDDVEWDVVEDRYSAALDRASALGLDGECARIKRSIARAAKHRPLEWQIIEQYYEDAAAAFEADGRPGKAAMTYRWLAETAIQNPDVGWDRALRHIEESTARFTELGNDFEVARNKRVFADTALEAGARPWSALESRYIDAIDEYQTADHPDRVARTYRKLGRTAGETAGGTAEDAEKYYQSAFDAFGNLERDETHRRVEIALDTVETFISADAHSRAVDWFTRAVETWCDGWTATRTTDESSALRESGVRLADVLQEAAESASTAGTETITEQWCHQLNDALSTSNIEQLSAAVAAVHQPTAGGDTHE